VGGKKIRGWNRNSWAATKFVGGTEILLTRSAQATFHSVITSSNTTLLGRVAGEERTRGEGLSGSLPVRELACPGACLSGSLPVRELACPGACLLTGWADRSPTLPVNSLRLASDPPEEGGVPLVWRAGKV
jgi:hypothetical protein